jgi:hypothetical protein
LDKKKGCPEARITGSSTSNVVPLPGSELSSGHRAAGFLRDAMHDRQPQPRARALASFVVKNGSEHVTSQLGVHTDAQVPDGNPRKAIRRKPG